MLVIAVSWDVMIDSQPLADNSRVFSNEAAVLLQLSRGTHPLHSQVLYTGMHVWQMRGVQD